MKYRIGGTLVQIFVGLFSLGAQPTPSVFSDGTIYRMGISNGGVYKIDRSLLATFEELDVNNLDPRNIHIYGNGGGLIPGPLSMDRVDDIEENPIYISGENDGSFDPGDYILFYAEGPDRYVVDDNDLRFEKNIYDLENYYFLKVDETPGKRIPTLPAPGVSESTLRQTTSILRHENDLGNLLGSYSGTQGSGQQWFGEYFANDREQSFSNSFRFSNITAGSDARFEVEFAGRSTVTTEFEIELDGQTFRQPIGKTNVGDVEATYARTGRISGQFTPASNNPGVTIRYLNSSQPSEGWLDYIEIRVVEDIVIGSDPRYVYHPESVNFNTTEYAVTGQAHNLTVWDITNPTNVLQLSYTNSSGEGRFAIENNFLLHTFYVFNKDLHGNVPTYKGKVSNQNIRSVTQADVLIIYHPDFEEAALRLAAHRQGHDNLMVSAVDVESIYNEFGGGRRQPVAVRDFIKHVYDRSPGFSFVVLLGDASYDYRGIVPGLAYQNFVPTYQTEESLDPILAFPTDDFFALLSNNEGDGSLRGALDVGVGRLPAKTNAEALAMVNKIIHYDTDPGTFGEWRLNVGFTADDEDANTHVSQSDEIARKVEVRHPMYNQQKVYLDAFIQEPTPGGARYPEANATLNNNIFKGQLILNYLGHGGPKGWAQERVLQVADINKWSNYNRLPIVITATCSFTGFDEPNFVSAGEHAILNPNGGAIALFSTVRAVYSASNKRLTESVFDTIFTRPENQRLRLGEIIRRAQNANSIDTISANTRKFMLFGDPSMQIASPEYSVVLTAIDGAPIDEIPDTVRALQRVELEGRMENSGSIVSSFNGKVFLTVFDKKSNLKTLGNDGNSNLFNFQVQKNILYKGSASVTNGTFKITFILPKDIDFNYGKGKLSFYATDNTTDAGGYYDNIIIGGTAETGIADEEGPEIDVYFDDRSFLFGGSTGPNPLLIIDLKDETGINLSSTSIGHDITAVLDGDIGNTIVLNDFYEPVTDKTGEGIVRFQIDGLEEGPHDIIVKAWDILNNSSESRQEFTVVDSEENFLKNVFNFPNPFSTQTAFTFEHNFTNTSLKILVEIYSVSGKLIKTINSQRFAQNKRIQDISWNGTDDYGSRIGKGVYLYKIKVHAPELNTSRESDFQKLVILK